MRIIKDTKGKMKRKALRRAVIDHFTFAIDAFMDVLKLAGYLAIIGAGLALFFMFPFGIIYYFNLCDKISNFGMLIIYLVELVVIFFIYSIYKSYRENLEEIEKENEYEQKTNTKI